MRTRAYIIYYQSDAYKSPGRVEGVAYPLYYQVRWLASHAAFAPKWIPWFVLSISVILTFKMAQNLYDLAADTEEPDTEHTYILPTAVSQAQASAQPWTIRCMLIHSSVYILLVLLCTPLQLNDILLIISTIRASTIQWWDPFFVMSSLQWRQFGKRIAEAVQCETAS